MDQINLDEDGEFEANGITVSQSGSAHYTTGGGMWSGSGDGYIRFSSSVGDITKIDLYVIDNGEGRYVEGYVNDDWSHNGDGHLIWNGTPANQVDSVVDSEFGMNIYEIIELNFYVQ